MTKQEVYRMIGMVAKDYGFRAEDDSRWGFQIIDDTRTVNFTVTQDHDFNLEGRTVTVTLKVVASIATMGGSPTGYDMIEAGNTIMDAGRFVLRLQMEQEADNMLTYTQSF